MLQSYGFCCLFFLISLEDRLWRGFLLCLFGLGCLLPYTLLSYLPLVRTRSRYESLSWAMQRLSHGHSSQDWRWTFNPSWAGQVFQTGNSELKLWETSQVVLGLRWPFWGDCAELRAVNMWNGEGGLQKEGSALKAQREAGMKGHIKWRKNESEHEEVRKAYGPYESSLLIISGFSVK